MTWSYSGDPSASSLDQTRFTLGDTDPTDPQLQDEEILSTLATESNEYAAAAFCCEVLAMKYARQCDRKLGRVMYLFASQMYTHYQQQATRLRAWSCQFNAPTSGGQSKSIQEGLLLDPDVIQPIFRRNIMASPYGVIGVLTTESDDV